MLHLLLLSYPGEFKGNVKKWQRESKKNFDSFFKLANRDRLIDFFSNNCSHLALPKKTTRGTSSRGTRRGHRECHASLVQVTNQ